MKRNVQLFFSTFTITMILLCSLCAFVFAGINSQETGFSLPDTILSVHYQSPEEELLTLIVLDHQCTIHLHLMQEVQQWCQNHRYFFPVSSQFLVQIKNGVMQWYYKLDQLITEKI